MSKTVFLYVSGGDYSASSFEENYNPQQVYEEMVKEGVTSKVFDGEYYIEVKIKEFGEVDPKFVQFVRDDIQEFEKDSDFFEVTSI